MTLFARPSYLGQWRTAEDSAGYSKLFFKFEETFAHAFIVRAVDSGFVICVPPAAIPEETLQQATAEHYEGVFGPWTATTIRAMSSTGRELQRTLPCLLVDINAAGVDHLSEAIPESEPTPFGTHRLQSVWPSARAAVVALEVFLNGDELVLENFERLEGYYTAASEAEAHTSPTEPTAGTLPQDLLTQLLNHSAEQGRVLSGLQAKLASLDSVDERLKQLEAEPRAPPPAHAAVGGRTTPADGIPAWAPQLFTEGARSTLAPGQVQKLLTLAGRGPTHLGDLPGPDLGSASLSLGARAKAKTTPPQPSAAALEDVEEVVDEPEGAEVGGKLLGQLLNQQTKILAQLAASARKSTDPMHLLGAGSSDDGAKLPGVRGMAARQLLKDQFQRNPLAIHTSVKERLAQVRRCSSVAEVEPRDMFLHFQETVPLGNFKTLTYLAFLMCDMWESIEHGRSEELMSLVALGLVFCEQVAHEQGQTRLAWLLTCREDPPFSLVETRKAPRSEVPHGALSDPRWVTAQLAYLRDVEQIQEKTNRLPLRGQPQEGVPPRGPGRRRPPKDGGEAATDPQA